MIVSRLALDSVWNRRETSSTTTCSRRHKYVERYFTLIPVQFTPFWHNSGTKPCLIADSHGEAKPSAFIKIYYFNCCSRLLPWGQSRTFTRIDTIHYSALVPFVVHPGFRLAERQLCVARAFKRNSPVIFFIQSTNACTLIYLGTRHQLDID